MRSMSLACGLFALTLVPTFAHADDITYTFDQTVMDSLYYGTFTVTGTLTTDGMTGTLQQSDVVSFDLTVDEDKTVNDTGSATFDSTASTTDLTLGGGVSATPTELLFDFGAADAQLEFQGGIKAGTSEDTGVLFLDQGREGFIGIGSGEIQYYTTDKVAIASVTPAATPEPGGLVLLGTGVLGMAGLVRRRVFKA